MKSLMKKLGYQFKNEALLRQALTRTSAVHESAAGAGADDYQPFELVGDAYIKAILSATLLSRLACSVGSLHLALKPLIANDGVMIAIAHSLHIDDHLIKGHGEVDVTNKMRVDAVEAILGAIAMDCLASKEQKALPAVILKLWAPYLPSAPSMAACASSSPAHAEEPLPELVAASAAAPSRSLTPRTQRLFTGGNARTVALADYAKYVAAAPDLNRQNIGKRGDTPLMAFFNNAKRMKDHQLPKIALLLAHGARWDAPNHKGETAEDLLKSKHPELCAQFGK